MAVAETGAIYKALTIDGVSSRDYGVYITGEAVFNAPKREVEMVSIAGRNGQLALDKGRFENIEVTYPAGIFADTEEDFAEAISNFRNFLCSRRGYVRIQDDYNSNEYRMGVYKSGLEVSPSLLKAGEFDIVFDCKPQRWLTEGETAVSVTSGDVLTNPTYFESHPLIEVEDYGTLSFNGYSMSIEQKLRGQLILAKAKTWSSKKVTSVYNTNLSLVNNGDTITVSPRLRINVGARNPYRFNNDETITKEGDEAITLSVSEIGTSDFTIRADATLTVAKGTTATWTGSLTISGHTRNLQSGSTYVYKVILAVTFKASANGFSAEYSLTENGYINTAQASSGISSIIADSTQSALGHPTYIDCELGEAYMIENDEVYSLNQYVDIGSDLPKLAVGDNTITFDETITSLKIAPRWWKV